MEHTVPSQMRAIRYNKIRDFELVRTPVPEPEPHEVLIKGPYPIACPYCSTLLSSVIHKTHITNVVGSQIVRNLRNRLAYSW